MPIPPEILAVPRPRNTFVVAYGKNRDRYAVRRYAGCRYDKGRRLPVKGPTVGHIAAGAYVPLPPPQPPASPDLQDWADQALCDRLGSDLLAELRLEFPPETALKLYCVALLRVCHPDARDRDLKDYYDAGVLGELRPGAALSRNTVSALHEDVGLHCTRIMRFMRRRSAAVGGGHLLLDGTLKGDESRVNSLSDFSRKARLKGSRDISILYAFDLARGEPVCAKCYPGNMLDATAVGDFIDENGIESGLLVGDKAFAASATASQRAAHPNLHHLNPLKRNSRFVATHALREYDGMLAERPGVTFRKARVRGKDKWLYAFRDADKAAAEERAWIAKARKNKTCTAAAHRKALPGFGTIVLESDLDLAPVEAYRAYAERWFIELVVRYQKVSCGLDDTRVHADASVIGSEFCNFLAGILTFRLLKAFDRAGLLARHTWGRIMALLRRAKRVRTPDGADWRLVKLAPSLEDLLRSLDLLPPVPAPIPRKPGRPRKTIS